VLSRLDVLGYIILNNVRHVKSPNFIERTANLLLIYDFLLVLGVLVVIVSSVFHLF